jgi:phosphopantothenate-cysteine ligase
MNVLITAGGTREDIDAVRGITNYATGRLGSLIADKFAENGHSVTYICGEDSVLPTVQAAETIRIKDTNDLSETIEKTLTENQYGIIIHSMAVSDYSPQRVLTMDGTPIDNQNKISSDISEIMIYLKQTPKIIGRMKALQPFALLIGFKLLMDVPEPELVEAAQRLMDKNSCDYVVANDLKHIKGDAHKAFLLDTNGNLQYAETKQEIAELIYNVLSERMINE